MRMVRRIRMIPLLVMALLGLVAMAAAPVAADTAYTCPAKTCTFSVPDFYSKVTSDESSIIFKDANSGGTFTVAITDFPPTGTLDDAVVAVVGQISGLKGFQPDPNGPNNETVGGNPARSLLYTYNLDDGTPAKAKVFFTVSLGKLYLLQFATTPDQEDAFVAAAQPVFDSWQFT